MAWPCSPRHSPTMLNLNSALLPCLGALPLPVLCALSLSTLPFALLACSSSCFRSRCSSASSGRPPGRPCQAGSPLRCLHHCRVWLPPRCGLLRVGTWFVDLGSPSAGHRGFHHGQLGRGLPQGPAGLEALGFFGMEVAETRPEAVLMSEYKDPRWCRGKGVGRAQLNLSTGFSGRPMPRVQGVTSGVGTRDICSLGP